VLERWNPERDLAKTRQEIDLLSVVEIAVGREENFWLDLAEPIHHALRPEIR